MSSHVTTVARKNYCLDNIWGLWLYLINKKVLREVLMWSSYHNLDKVKTPNIINIKSLYFEVLTEFL